MNYQDVINDMFQKLPMYSRIGASAYKADLSNTWTLCEYAQHPEKKLRAIHIAGTNGKGSVSNMLASIFQEAGYKTGLYTSPHLKDFRERIRINGAMISEEDVIKYYQLLNEKSVEIGASFFEMTVVMAFSYFVDQQVDIAIIETGLGGRLDSTNVLHPELSIITNIALDHQQFLGNTLEEIASEKAGIIKKHIPVVIGEFHPKTADVFIKKSIEESAPIYFSKSFKNSVEIIDNKYFIINNDTINCPLTAQYQVQNIQTVLASVEVLNQTYSDIHLSHEAVKNGLENILNNTGFQGRWQKIHDHPKVIVDVGHNEDGIQEIVKQISKENFKHLRIVYGAVKDKDVSKILALLPHPNTSYYLCEPPLPRKLPLEDLVEKTAVENLSVAYTHPDPKTCYEQALKDADVNDLVIVLGSFFVVGEIL